MEKNTLIGFVLIGAVLIGFSFFNRPSTEEQAQMQHYQDSIQALVEQHEAKQAAQQQLAMQQAAAEDSTSLLFYARQGQESVVTLQNNLVDLFILVMSVEGTLAAYSRLPQSQNELTTRFRGGEECVQSLIQVVKGAVHEVVFQGIQAARRKYLGVPLFVA